MWGTTPGSNSTDDFKVKRRPGGAALTCSVDGVSIFFGFRPIHNGIRASRRKAVSRIQSCCRAISRLSMGNPGDGIVSLTLKSGTNELHASAL